MCAADRARAAERLNWGLGRGLHIRHLSHTGTGSR
jgi:hypothetical protein